MTNCSVWNVSLYPVVQNVLLYIHEHYFRRLDAWSIADISTRGPPPSTVTVYKEYLRQELSQKIAGIHDS